MEKTTFESVLERQPDSALVVCNKRQIQGKEVTTIDVKYAFSQNPNPTNISEIERMRLLQLMQTSPKKALDELITYRLQDQLITGVYTGRNGSVLPTRYQRFYDQCILFESANYRIYFTDFAMTRFSDTIFKLTERSKKDSLTFVTGKISEKKARHLHLGVYSGYDWCLGRHCLFYGEQEEANMGPSNAVYYSTDLKEDGSVDFKDSENMMKMIDTFAQVYGEFHNMKWNRQELVANNQGSLKIAGIDKSPELYDKVYSLMKK